MIESLRNVRAMEDKMRKYYYPGGAVLLGAIGFCVRRWQLATCFESNRLPIPGLATNVLIGLTVAAAALFLAMVIPLHGQKNWSAVFGQAPCHWLKLTAGCYLLSGVTFLRSQTMMQTPSAVFQIANILLPFMLVCGTFLSAMGLWFLSRGGKVPPLAVMAPGFCGCFWLVNTYHNHANDPVVIGFAWTVLAIIASILAWYEMAGFSLGKGHSRLTLFWSLMTITLTITALADGGAWYILLLLAAQAISFTVQSVRLVDKMEFKKPGAEGNSTQEAAE